MQKVDQIEEESEDELKQRDNMDVDIEQLLKN